MDTTLVLIGIAWLAIFAMLVWGLGVSLVRGLGRIEEPPFFVMLERRGLNALQLEAAVGAGGMARALRRCARCPARGDCARRSIECPNEALFAYARRLSRA